MSSGSTVQFAWRFLLLVACTLGSAPAMAESPPVAVAEPQAEAAFTVHLASGRSMIGTFDPRSDASQLWLRSRQGPMTISRPIDWDRVVRAEIAGQTISGQQFRSVVAAVRVVRPVAEGDPAPLVQPVRDGASARPEPPPPEPPAKVRSLLVEADLANWDSDVEADGLVVRIAAVDETGRLASVDGTLEVELLTDLTGPVRQPQPFRQIGRWTRRVQAGDFAVGSAAYRLEFQGVHPEFDRQVAAHGAVHARLSVPGQGVFEATASTVRIRTHSPVRDRLEQATDGRHRFFPAELTGDGRR